jgi:tetratricopeptide (TPR) repeat protein
MKSVAYKILVLLVCLTSISTLLGLRQADTYNQEYDHYMKAEAETDPAKREALLLEFIQSYSQSELDPNVSYLYAQSYQRLRESGRWQQLATKAEQFLRYRSSDTAAIQAATEAYQQLGNPQKLVDFGSKLYAEKPNATTAYFVAKAQQSLGNQVGLRTWAERTIQHDPNNIDMLVQLATSYWGTNELTKAASYARKGLASVEKAQKPESEPADQWDTRMNQIRGFFYRAVGEKTYVDKEINAARENFEAATRYDPMNDFGHYRLGFIHWGAGKTDQAILSFAKASLLNGPSSKDARDQLYQLYRATHSDTTGLPSLIQRVRKDMGL